MRNSYRDRRDETGSNHRSWKSSQFSNIVERRLERAAMTEEESKGERKNETSISVVPKKEAVYPPLSLCIRLPACAYSLVRQAQ